MVIVIMGPAGAGKSTVGQALADRIGWMFVDADDYHSPANIAKMSRGEPLTDRDRAGWLDAIHAIVVRAIDRREPLVVACSALTAAYRTHVAGELHPVRFVYLRASREVLESRLATRQGHFAGGSLLDSQLQTLEEPDDREAITVDGAADVETIVGHIQLAFGV